MKSIHDLIKGTHPIYKYEKIEGKQLYVKVNFNGDSSIDIEPLDGQEVSMLDSKTLTVNDVSILLKCDRLKKVKENGKNITSVEDLSYD